VSVVSKVLWVAGFLWSSSHPLAALDFGPAQPASWTVHLENDSFLTTDRYYTNGLRYTRTFTEDGLPGWARRTRWMEPVLNSFHLCHPGESGGSCYHFETAWTFGQNLYTPENLRASRLLRSQRPYGAWLYYGNVLTLRNSTVEHTVEVDLGVAGGSLTLGEQVQRNWHRLLRTIFNSDDPPDPQGWGNQIHNQPGLQVFYQGRRQSFEKVTDSDLRYFDATPQINAALGTVSVYGSVGGTLRLGYNVPREFPTLIPPVPAPHPQALDASHPPARRLWEVYGFARADQRYVAYSAFLDGNIHVFGRSHSVVKDPWVTDLQAGAVVGHDRWRLSATLVDRSPEFRAQRRHQRFVSLTFMHRR